MKLHPRLTAQAVVLARRGERFRPDAERDVRGWVVGYGHRASAREGAHVTEADALALLTYDLSQSAGRVEPLLQNPVPPALFDALNAYAFRVGADPFARSEVLRRVNAGEAVTPAEVAAAGAPAQGPPLAVSVAADAVRDRLAQVLADPEPPPPRTPRGPWREPGVAPPEPQDAPRARPFPETGGDEPASPFVASFGPTSGVGDAAHEGGPADAFVDEPTAGFAGASDIPASAPPPPPVVSFERGGRARSWARLRANPVVYVALGGCGVVLFAISLIGFLLGRPTGSGLALGIAGVICLAPALAFFLHRRGAA